MWLAIIFGSLFLLVVALGVASLCLISSRAGHREHLMLLTHALRDHGGTMPIEKLRQLFGGSDDDFHLSVMVDDVLQQAIERDLIEIRDEEIVLKSKEET